MSNDHYKILWSNHVNTEGFRNFLQERRISEDKIDQLICIIEMFEEFLMRPGQPEPHKSPTSDDVKAFSAILVKERLNTYDSYRALALYGRFLKNNEIYIATVELEDGAEALESLYEKVGKSVGEQKRDEIFRGIELPPLGTPNSQKPRVTQAVMERFESLVEPETCKKILSSGLRRLEDEWFHEDRKKYLECKNFNVFLERRGQEFIALFEQIKREKGLYFTQEITDEVIDFVQSHPEIRQGVRQGNILYEIKIPHMARKYLAETDEGMKRYYYCHCPWVKESLRTDNIHISPTFCNCSAGFHKKYWEVVLGQPLEAEIMGRSFKETCGAKLPFIYQGAIH